MYDKVIGDIDPQGFTSEKQRNLLDYWLQIRGARNMPRRQDLNPMDIPHLLSAIWMADVVPGGNPGFKVRLFGTDLVQAFQLEGTDMLLDQISFTKDIIARLTTLTTTGKAYYYKAKFPIESEDYNYYTTLTLPMSSNNETVDIIISQLDFLK